MNIRILLLLFVLSVTTRNLSAQYDFFWSFNDLNGGATNGDVEGNLSVGDSASLFLYYSTNGPTDVDIPVGVFIDVETSIGNVIEFTAAESFDFDITINGIDIDNRWLDEQGGGGSAGHTGTVTDNFINEWNAFTVTGGTGILEANNGSGIFLDEGYDASADAFLFGRIDFNVVGNGTVDILGSVDAFPGCEFFCKDLPFGTATINVGVIPEPGVSVILLISMTGLVRRRRER